MVNGVRCLNIGPQSRQSSKLILQSSELGLPQPLTLRRGPPLWFRGEDVHSLATEGVGESEFRRGDIHCGTLNIYVLCALGQPYLLIPSQLNQSSNCHHYHASYFQSLRKSPSSIFTPLIPFLSLSVFCQSLFLCCLVNST